ncbi:MAG: Flp family type IVb pilin [Alcanivorax sediminis]|uniref:Flp family type IVb pilin n=1 Tax=Alcanivorax sediminis TaxID=2663008 RepID=UPI003C3DA6F8
MSSLSRFYQSLMARLFTRMPGRAHGQRGASALEYIVLAAALIIIIGVLATNTTVQDALNSAFENLFADASNAGG